MIVDDEIEMRPRLTHRGAPALTSLLTTYHYLIKAASLLVECWWTCMQWEREGVHAIDKEI